MCVLNVCLDFEARLHVTASNPNLCIQLLAVNAAPEGRRIQRDPEQLNESQGPDDSLGPLGAQKFNVSVRIGCSEPLDLAALDLT